jgi:hypothetical protein
MRLDLGTRAGRNAAVRELAPDAIRFEEQSLKS